MESNVDLSSIVENRKYISKLGTALDTTNCIVKKQIFQLLSTLCAYNEDGYKRTIEALDFYKKLKNDRQRFTIVINELEMTTNTEYQIALIEFINAVITTTTNLQERIRIRNEFIDLKLLSIFHKLRKNEHIDANTVIQMDAFDEQKECDEAQQQQNLCGINLNSHLDVFYAILRQIAETPRYEAIFLGILQHLLRIDPKDAISDTIWNTIEKLVHRAILLENENDSIRLLRPSAAPPNFTCGHCRKEFNTSSRKPTANTTAMNSASNSSANPYTSMYKPPPPPPPPEIPTVPPPPPPMALQSGMPAKDLDRENLTKSRNQQNCQKIITPPKSALPEPKSSDIRLPQQDTPAPKTKMRTINWGKIPPNKVLGKQNIWTIVANNHQHNPIADIDWNEMEGLFCIQPMNSTNLSKSGQSKKSTSDCSSGYDTLERKSKKENNEITLLDGKRSLNINIYLKQFKGYNSYEDIIRFVCEGNHAAFGAEKLRGLLKILPEIEESDMLKSFSGDRQRLAKAEKFLIQLMEISNYKLRIESMLLKEEFSTNILYLKPCINAMIFAGDALMSSQHLREVLYMVLVAGNFLNSGGYAGNAAGIKLASLQKLTDIRANKPGINLIHFVANQAGKRNPALLNFTNELNALDSTSKTSVDQISHEINTLESRIQNIKRQIEQPTIDVDIKEQMLEFLVNSEHEVVGELQKRMKDVEATRLKLADFFCEDSKTFKLEECYKIFQTFCEKFRQAVKENQQRQLLEDQANVRRKQREELLAQRAQYVLTDTESNYNLNTNSTDSTTTSAASSNSVEADITPNGSMRKRRSRMLAEENDLMEFLRKSGQMQKNIHESKAAYGSLDRSWSRRARSSSSSSSRRKESDNLNITINTNRERAVSSSPMLGHSKALPAPPSPVNDITTPLREEVKPRIPSEWHQEIRTWLQLNDCDKKVNDDYKRKRHMINANKWTLENDIENERKLDTLPEEKYTPLMSNVYTESFHENCERSNKAHDNNLNSRLKSSHSNMKTKQYETMPTTNIIEKSTSHGTQQSEVNHKSGNNNLYHKHKNSSQTNINSNEPTSVREGEQVRVVSATASYLTNAGAAHAKDHLICDEELKKSASNPNESIQRFPRPVASINHNSTSENVVDGNVNQSKNMPSEKQMSENHHLGNRSALHSSNRKEIDADNIETPPATRRNPCGFITDLGIDDSIGTTEKCNNMGQKGDQNIASHFDRYSSARRTRRFKRTSDNNTGHEDFNSTKDSSEEFPLRHYKTYEGYKPLNKNLENRSKIEKHKNASSSERSPASSIIEINKLDRIDHHVNISEQDVQKAIRNLKSPTDTVIKRLWDHPPNDSVKTMPQPTDLTSTNLSIIKTANNELNDEGFEEAQSFISDSASHSKESTNSSCNEIKETHSTLVKKSQIKEKIFPVSRTPSKPQQLKTKNTPTAKPHSPSTHSMLRDTTFTPKKKISIKISTKAKPKETNAITNTRVRTSIDNALNRTTTLRYAFAKSANIATNIADAAAAADQGNVERSNSHNSLRSSRSSINSSVSTNTVRCMPIIVRKQTISPTPSSHKRTLAISNAKLESPQNFLDRVSTSRSSSSGSSIGHNSSISQKIPTSLPHTKATPAPLHQYNSATTSATLGSAAFRQPNCTSTRPQTVRTIEALKTNLSHSSFQTNRQGNRRNNPAINSPIKHSYRFMKPTTSSSTKHK